jgi:hypothetical protein
MASSASLFIPVPFVPSTIGGKKIGINTPTPYDGDRNNLQNFLQECKNVNYNWPSMLQLQVT